MTDTITVRGFVATRPSLRQTFNNTHVSDFRLASTSRRYDADKGEWVDAGATNWYTVTSYRYLADNVAVSLTVGDAVLVHGRLKIREWTDNSGRKRHTVEIEATSVGPDLALGSAKYSRAGGGRNNGATQENTASGDQGVTSTSNDDARLQESGNSLTGGGPDPESAQTYDSEPNCDPDTGEVFEEGEGGVVDRMTAWSPEDDPMTGGVGLQPGEVADLNQESRVEFHLNESEADAEQGADVMSGSTR
ncbi:MULTISPECIES: single-stranded DNA-binding protein [Kocuria]|uniref:Single-stranded DNA-binding protein n=1 Tax=Kocuria subflava TaxID=1736139 RepID=A0A846U4D4_9MICC|nr:MULTISPECIES: single-stranded DNA-binding protein [Kocuria]NKE09631.1 single-stranded DNA-binding protein [Kocuria subflava]